MKASSASARRARRTSAAPSVRPVQPFNNLRFAVGIEGMQHSGAVEVVLPAARIVENPRSRRTVQFDPLVLRRGLTDSTEWYDWWNEARRSTRAPRRLINVIVLRPDGAEGVRWFFRDSVPVSYALSPLNALAGATLIESLEIRVGNFELFQRQ